MVPNGGVVRARGLPKPLRAALAAGLLLLAGCAPQFWSSPSAFQAEAPALNASPRFETGFMVADDGAKLPLRVWLPQGQPKAVIVALHGFNDYSDAFSLPAPVWADHGIATYAYDQRGFGANRHAGHWPGTDTFCLDLATALRLAQERWPDLPVYLLGESMGGATALVAASHSCSAPPIHPAGLILVAPAVWARSTMPWINRAALWSSARLFPWKTFTGRGFRVLASDNIPMLIQLGRDPLVIKATRVDAVYGLANLMDDGYRAHPDPSLPTLLLYGANDELIPPLPMYQVVTRLAAEDPSLRFAYYAHGWHMMLRDLEYRDVATDVASWIADHDAPFSSNADTAGVRFLHGPPPASGRITHGTD
jgi:acylglycerol lipase